MKLINLVFAILASTTSVKRYFSALKRIKTYNKNRIVKDRLSSLVVFVIKMESLQKLCRNKEGFHNRATNVFIQKDNHFYLCVSSQNALLKSSWQTKIFDVLGFWIALVAVKTGLQLLHKPDW